MMRTVSGAVILAVALSAACANKTAQTPAPAGTAAAGGGATAGGGAAAGGGAQAGAAAGGGAQAGARAGGAGAQAAARLTVEDLDARMKTIGATSGTMRTKIMNNMLMDAAKDAQTLATAFGDVERFFTQNNKPDAVMLAQQARTAATDAAGAATGGDAAKATAAASNMTATCKQCHSVYREGDAQTGFRVKAGAL